MLSLCRRAPWLMHPIHVCQHERDHSAFRVLNMKVAHLLCVMSTAWLVVYVAARG